MNNLKRLYPVILIVIVFVVWKFRQTDDQQLVSVEGQTMGTTYSIKYLTKNPVDYKEQIDSILIDFNNSLSTYIPTSSISVFNDDTVMVYRDPYFYQVLLASENIYKNTNGAFDPTVGPLVSAWGFGPEEKELPSQQIIDSLLQFIGFDGINYDEERVSKPNSSIKIDFSAIAKGYGVDVVSEFIESKGVDNYFVEIGGEVRGRGTNVEGTPWRVGIEDPTSSINARELSFIVSLQDKSMATSGNYRNYYIKDGVRYAHTIDPKTGYPVEHSLLSSSVFSSNCIDADGYATAFMVMGLKDAIQIVEENNSIDAFFIYDDAGELKTYVSPGLEDFIVK